MADAPVFHQLTTQRGDPLPDPPWDDYPRPQLRRGSWIDLNGLWDYAVDDMPAGQIRVPFPPESALSGIGKQPPGGAVLRYRRSFEARPPAPGSRLLLHCGGVDQRAVFLLNGRTVGTACTLTEGPFTVELTGVRPGSNELTVLVTDDLRDRSFPYGKQKQNRGGMWYTPVSGIWQTVWLEWVSEVYITRIRLTPTLKDVTVEVFEQRDGKERPAKSGSLEFEGRSCPLREGKAVLAPASPELWTPEHPKLYDFTVRTPHDEAQSYFALRTVGVGDTDGVPRLLLNGAPYFFHGLLDQGWWPDGLWTPADPRCFDDEIRTVKSLGFNTLRKHIKLEPEAFYYACDRLGILVFQDLINNGRYSFLRDTALPTVGLQRFPQIFRRTPKRCRERFEAHLRSSAALLYNHPCVVYWTIFNEGWGQHDAAGRYELLKELDPTRIVDTASGWFRTTRTDVESRHVYFRRFRLPKRRRPVVLSEFGGYVYKDEDHCFNPRKTYGYRLFGDKEAWQRAVLALYETQILPAIPKGLCGAVYTQVSDVEDETNGLLTYDRRVCKADPAQMKALARRLAAAIQSGP